MFLSDSTILQYVDQNKISVRPRFDREQLRPFGIRVHLASEVLRPIPGKVIDLSQEPSGNIHYSEDIREKGLTLEPGAFVLGATVESLKVAPDLLCHLDGRSTLARLGISIHCTAGVIDSNQYDHRVIVLEITNNSPSSVRIPYLFGIGMVVFSKVSEPVSQDRIQDQYAHQDRGVVGPNLLFRAAPFDPAIANNSHL